MRARRPDLGAIDHEVIAGIDRAGLEAGEVGAGVGLGEALAPADLAARHRRQQLALLFFRAGIQDGVGRQHRRQEGRAEKPAAHLLQHDREVGLAAGEGLADFAGADFAGGAGDDAAEFRRRVVGGEDEGVGEEGIAEKHGRVGSVGAVGGIAAVAGVGVAPSSRSLPPASTAMRGHRSATSSTM